MKTKNKTVWCITGGIGSGKSTVASLLADQGFPVYVADDRAKWLMSHDEHLRAEIIALFGKDAYDLASGSLNRAYLAQKIFANADLRKALEGLVHPVVRLDFSRWLEAQDNAVIFKESALVFEVGDPSCSAVLAVLASENLRIQRAIERGAARADVVRRIKNQVTDSVRRERANHLIVNEGTLEELKIQVNYFLTKCI